jgi:hypothetical protein
MEESQSTPTAALAPSARSAFLRRFGFPIALVVLILVHLGLTFYYERPSIVLGKDPIAWLDYDTHIEQNWRVTEALKGWGRAWAYDVQLLAGFPNGTIFDADNKGWELWTFGLWKLGVPRPLACNLFILCAHLMLPLVVFFSARLFGARKWPALLATALAMAIWFFDALPHWCWFVGMISYAIAGYAFLLPLALFYRYLKDGRWWHLLLAAPLMAWGHLIHPYTFIMLVFPMIALYARAFKRLGWRRHAAIVGMAALVLATNLYWLVTAVRFWHYILNSAFYCQSTISFLFTDYMGLMKEPTVTGVVGNRTGFRFLSLAAAIVMLVLWRKDKDDRFLPFMVGLAALLGITYLGGYSVVFSQVQPYRHALPAMFLTVIPAALLIERIWTSGVMRKLPRLAYVAFGLVLVVAVPHLARDVLYFVPALLPVPKDMPDDKGEIDNPIVFGSMGYPKHMEFRHQPLYKDFTDVTTWVSKYYDDQGRILVEWWILGEHLAWRTRAQILGGFREINLQHSASNLFRRNDDGDLPKEELRRYLIDYAVKWIIVTHPKPKFENNPDLFEPAGYVPHPSNPADMRHRLYKSKLPVTYFAENSGRVRASMNRIEVARTDPGKDVVLRFHYLETLLCKPDCTIVKEPLPKDPVGFIRVPAPHPRNFVIVNGY